MDKAAYLLKHLAELAIEPANELKDARLSVTYCAVGIAPFTLSPEDNFS
jgi:hypothetical protein